MLEIAETIPTYFIRFEDMITEPVPVLLECMKFILDVKSIEGTIVEQRVIQKCGDGSRPKPAYKLKEGGSRLCKYQDQYTDK